jgi:hypothetical protein
MADWRRGTRSGWSLFFRSRCVQRSPAHRNAPRRAPPRCPALAHMLSPLPRRCRWPILAVGNQETRQLLDVWAGHLRTWRERELSPAQRAYHGAGLRRAASPELNCPRRCFTGVARDFRGATPERRWRWDCWSWLSWLQQRCSAFWGSPLKTASLELVFARFGGSCVGGGEGGHFGGLGMDLGKKNRPLLMVWGV